MLEAENTAKRMLVDPSVKEFRIPFGFFPEQIGLQPCMVGADGRIWCSSDRGRVFTLVFDPKWIQQRRDHGEL